MKKSPYIVFVDEAGFMLAPLPRRTWAPRGRTPVVRVSEPHARISAIGAMTISPERRRFAFHWHLLADNVNFRGDSIVSFLTQLRRKIRAPLIVIWDEIAIHHSKPMCDFIAANRQAASVHPFPPYAPELNPVDRVWGYVKYNRLANYCPHDLAELRERLTAEFAGVQKRPALLKSLFNSTVLNSELSLFAIKFDILVGVGIYSSVCSKNSNSATDGILQDRQRESPPPFQRRALLLQNSAGL